MSPLRKESMDKELFDLCREVYEKTGWHEDLGSEAYYKHEHAPAYTSDYLLPKIEGYAWIELASSKTSNWRVNFEPHTTQVMDGTYGKTPLIALLKVVIALHEAGELT